VPVIVAPVPTPATRWVIRPPGGLKGLARTGRPGQGWCAARAGGCAACLGRGAARAAGVRGPCGRHQAVRALCDGVRRWCRDERYRDERYRDGAGSRRGGAATGGLGGVEGRGSRHSFPSSGRVAGLSAVSRGTRRSSSGRDRLARNAGLARPVAPAGGAAVHVIGRRAGVDLPAPRHPLDPGFGVVNPAPCFPRPLPAPRSPIAAGAAPLPVAVGAAAGVSPVPGCAWRVGPGAHDGPARSGHLGHRGSRSAVGASRTRVRGAGGVGSGRVAPRCRAVPSGRSSRAERWSGQATRTRPARGGLASPERAVVRASPGRVADVSAVSRRTRQSSSGRERRREIRVPRPVTPG
jgi:hypothetical protein